MKSKFYTQVREATREDGTKSIVTVVGHFVEYTEDKKVCDYADFEIKPNKIIPSKITYYEPKLKRELTIGIAICHEGDKFSTEEGVRIATERIKKGYTSGTVSTSDITMLTKDMIAVIMENKLKWICEHIDRYVGSNNAVSMHY